MEKIHRAFCSSGHNAHSLNKLQKNPTTPDVEALTRPVIWLNTFELTFTASETGTNPPSKILKVKNSGKNTLNYTISDDADWLSVEPVSGTSRGEIIEHNVSVDKSGLSVNDQDYAATITVSCSDAYNNPQ